MLARVCLAPSLSRRCDEIKITGHVPEDLGCIHHIAGEDSLAEDSHRRS